MVNPRSASLSPSGILATKNGEILMDKNFVMNDASKPIHKSPPTPAAVAGPLPPRVYDLELPGCREVQLSPEEVEHFKTSGVIVKKG